MLKEWIRSVTSISKDIWGLWKVFANFFENKKVYKRIWVEEKSSKESIWSIIEAKAIIRYVRLIRFYIRIVRIKKEEGHLVDALAIRGEEGRGTLRKVMGRWEQSVIREYPNGGTHRVIGIINWIHRLMKRTQGTETSKYLKERKSNETPRVVASEIGQAKWQLIKNRNNMERLTWDSDSLVRVESWVVRE